MIEEISLQQDQRKRACIGSPANRLRGPEPVTLLSGLQYQVVAAMYLHSPPGVWAALLRGSLLGKEKVLEHSPANTPSTKSTPLPEGAQEQET